MIAEIIRGFVEGVLRPLIESWQQYLHGRAAQQRDDAKGALEIRKEIDDALAADRADRPTVDELRSRIGKNTTPH